MRRVLFGCSFAVACAISFPLMFEGQTQAPVTQDRALLNQYWRNSTRRRPQATSMFGKRSFAKSEPE
jgi:isochorismate hydrolase